jgi:hypothetical protein
MRLFPSPLVLLYLPCINDISHKVENIAGVVLQKVIQFLGLAITGAKVNIGDEDTTIGVHRGL